MLEKKSLVIANEVWEDYKKGLIVEYDDLLGAVDDHMLKHGMNPVDDDGDSIVDYIKDTYRLVVCDMCGKLERESDESHITDNTTICANLAEMNHAGITDYLRDDLRSATVLCAECRERVAGFKPEFEWAGCAYASQAELDADKARGELLNERGVSLDELPRWAKLELKRNILDHQNSERGEGTSMGELVAADYYITDAELAEQSGGFTFFAEDFAGAPTE